MKKQSDFDKILNTIQSGPSGSGSAGGPVAARQQQPVPVAQGPQQGQLAPPIQGPAQGPQGPVNPVFPTNIPIPDLSPLVGMIAKDASFEPGEVDKLQQMFEAMKNNFTGNMSPEQKQHMNNLTNQITGPIFEQLKDIKPKAPEPDVFIPDESDQRRRSSKNYGSVKQANIMDARIQAQLNEHQNYQQSRKSVSPDFEIIDDPDDLEAIEDLEQLRTKDYVIKLNVSLEDLYKGAKKKIAITRNRIKSTPKGPQVVEERKKIAIDIEPGMYDETILRYSREASEEPGHLTGDIVVILKQNGHPEYERKGPNLIVYKNISLFESYAVANNIIGFYIELLDGSKVRIDSMGIPLHENNGFRIIRGLGMPILDSEDSDGCITYGDLIVRFNLVLPEKLSDAAIKSLHTAFPVMNETLMDPNDKKTRVVQTEPLSEEDMRELNKDYDEDDLSEESEYEESEESEGSGSYDEEESVD
jgi:DnaJ-class molecular chaperone